MIVFSSVVGSKNKFKLVFKLIHCTLTFVSWNNAYLREGLK